MPDFQFFEISFHKRPIHSVLFPIFANFQALSFSPVSVKLAEFSKFYCKSNLSSMYICMTSPCMLLLLFGYTVIMVIIYLDLVHKIHYTVHSTS